jgi:hypothetical protein
MGFRAVNRAIDMKISPSNAAGAARDEDILPLDVPHRQITGRNHYHHRQSSSMGDSFLAAEIIREWMYYRSREKESIY